MSDATTTTPTPVTTPPKPGWKTTEFWLSLLAVVLGALLTSGLLADGSAPLRIAGIATTVLAALGYTGARASVKNAASMLALFVLGSMLLTSTPGCAHNADGTTNARATTVNAAIVSADVTAIAFGAWDRQHELAVVAGSTSTTDANTKLAAYRAKRDAVLHALDDLTAKLKTASMLSSDQAIADAVAAATTVQELWNALKGGN